MGKKIKDLDKLFAELDDNDEHPDYELLKQDSCDPAEIAREILGSECSDRMAKDCSDFLKWEGYLQRHYYHGNVGKWYLIFPYGSPDTFFSDRYSEFCDARRRDARRKRNLILQSKSPLRRILVKRKDGVKQHYTKRLRRK